MIDAKQLQIRKTLLEMSKLQGSLKKESRRLAGILTEHLTVGFQADRD
jgi:hypothetical protein